MIRYFPTLPDPFGEVCVNVLVGYPRLVTLLGIKTVQRLSSKVSCEALRRIEEILEEDANDILVASCSKFDIELPF